VSHPLEYILKHFTYKPGWGFNTIVDADYIILTIMVEAIDADCPSRKIVITTRATLDRRQADIMDTVRLQRWLRDSILTVERHEMDEFFQIDGIKVFDPHPEFTSFVNRSRELANA